MKIKVFAKNKPGLKEAIDFLYTLTDDIELFIGNVGEPLPEKSKNTKCDIIISYISPWIIPLEILKLAKLCAINFHPGPPEYPGIGCTNFALYEDANSFGVTCHLMEPQVDSGKIISVKRFPIYKNDTVETLTERAYAYLLIQFYEVISEIFTTGKLTFSNERWSRKPFTRKQLNELSEITLDMNQEEVTKRIRATYFPNYPYPFIRIHGFKFIYFPESKSKREYE